jgi:hypothetical protein
MSTPFWLNDPKILWHRYDQFIPRADMSVVERYNAITLFLMYFAMLVFLLIRNKTWAYLSVVGIILIILIQMQTKELFEPIIESGYIDSDDTMRFNRVTGRKTDTHEVSYECRPPTAENPFMNPPITDFNKDAPSACNADDNDINEQITKAFNSDLFSDIDDVFNKTNSQRQFYTVPNTSIPNHQNEFANWLFRAPVTCKEDQDQCLRYEDLRFKR